jgi:hypothetical protein
LTRKKDWLPTYNASTLRPSNDWKMGRIVAISAFLIVAFLAMGVVFWQQELKYQLPTPVPVQYQSVAMVAAKASNFAELSFGGVVEQTTIACFWFDGHTSIRL